MQKFTTLRQGTIDKGTPKYISVNEMAKMLSIARVTAYQLVKTKDFPCFYIGRRVVIPLQSFIRWTEEQANNQAIFLKDLG